MDAEQNTGDYDHEMFNTIERYKPFFKKIAATAQDANDILQEVHIKFYKYSQKNPGWWAKIEKKGAYIMRAGKNANINMHRAAPEKKDSIDEPDPTGSRQISDGWRGAQDIEDNINRDEIRQKLVQAMESLTDDEKQLIKLSYFEGCKPKQIAKMLGRDHRYVQVDCNAARAKFRARIQALLKDEVPE